MSRSKRDIWKELVDEAGKADIEAAASVSVEQAEAELKAAGFDVAAERAKAGAFLDDLGKPRADEPAAAAEPPATDVARAASGLLPVRAVAQQAPRAKAPERSRRRFPPALAWLAAATVTVGAGGLIYVATHPSPPEPIGPVPPTSVPPEPSPADLVAAADLRRKATAACEAKQWPECLQALDRARDLDPAGDDAPPVKAMRAKAVEGHDKPPPKP